MKKILSLLPIATIGIVAQAVGFNFSFRLDNDTVYRSGKFLDLKRELDDQSDLPSLDCG